MEKTFHIELSKRANRILQEHGLTLLPESSIFWCSYRWNIS